MAVSVPSFVIDYAPLVWLHENETYFPSDLGAQLVNTVPEVNYSVVTGAPSPLTLDNLDALNDLGGTNVFLTSKDPPPYNATWLNGVVPDASGKCADINSTVVITNDHGSGVVDAFYFYFYAYNKGSTVFGREYGDHVGDIEHTMVRFINGTPDSMWFSQHSFGQAFEWDAVEKNDTRAYSYSAIGTHANWATAGTHVHDTIVEDFCSRGKLWDPILSAYFYSYDAVSTNLTAAGCPAPVAYLNFIGQWGDKQFPKSYPGQYEAFGNYHYVDGPRGPRDKQLNRTTICPDSGGTCIVRNSTIAS